MSALGKLNGTICLCLLGRDELGLFDLSVYIPSPNWLIISQTWNSYGRQSPSIPADLSSIIIALVLNTDFAQIRFFVFCITNYFLCEPLCGAMAVTSVQRGVGSLGQEWQDRDANGFTETDFIQNLKMLSPTFNWGRVAKNLTCIWYRITYGSGPNQNRQIRFHVVYAVHAVTKKNNRWVTYEQKR